MHSHKARVNVTDAREVRVKLPSDFPSGEAEVTVTAASEEGISLRTGQRAAEQFETWLAELLRRLPKSTVVPPEAMDRAHIYDE